MPAQSQFEVLIRIAEVAVGLLILGVQLGRWGGKLEARRAAKAGEKGPASVPAPAGNGTPTIGELDRRVKALEDSRLPRLEFDSYRQFTDREIKDLKNMDLAQQRRIDDLVAT